MPPRLKNYSGDKMNVEPWPPRWLTPVADVDIERGKGLVAIDFAQEYGIITKDSVAGNSGTNWIYATGNKNSSNIFLRSMKTGD